MHRSAEIILKNGVFTIVLAKFRNVVASFHDNVINA